MATVAVLAWWGGRVTAPGPVSGGDVVVAEVRRAKEQLTEPEAKTEVVAASVAQLATPEPMPMTAALDAASPSLRRCAGIAGETIFVNFSAARGRDRFDTVTVLGEHDDEVARCVRGAGAEIRFAPATAQSMMKEYTP